MFHIPFMSVESIPATAGWLPDHAPSGHDDTGEVRQDLRVTKLLSCAVDLLVVFFKGFEWIIVDPF
jgi:hypothetical protein